MRYITVIIAVMLLAAPAMADTYGTTVSSWSTATSGDFTAYMYFIPFTVGASDQVADSGRFYARDIYENTDIQMSIYEVSGSDTIQVDSTESGTFGTTDDRQWQALDFQAGATLSAGGTYLLGLSGSGDATIHRGDSTGFTRIYLSNDGGDFSLWPDTLTGHTIVADMTIPIHVMTSDAGGEPPAETGQIIMIKEN
jgi:hypothetical protein